MGFKIVKPIGNDVTEEELSAQITSIQNSLSNLETGQIPSLTSSKIPALDVSARTDAVVAGWGEP